MSEKTFPLERFYYGVLKGQASSKPTVLARTAGITPDMVKEALLVARLAPPTVDQISDKMSASIGIFRGEKLDFVMTVAQMNQVGIPQLLFVVLPKGPMSWLAGNLQPFRSLGNLEMPVFTAARDNLTPFILKDPKPATATQQSKVMSNFLFYCNDNMNIAEGVLTALVEGKSLAILNAPNSLDKRLNFVEGLLALLPPPVRIRVTFATNVLKADSSLAQIKFLVSPEGIADNHLIFDWQAGTIKPEKYERHDYPKFILAQLRLDPDHVLEHTESLSRTTAWRAMRNDSLGDALAWAAQRARIDATVQTGQPADRDKVATILRQDPTLSNELRVAYAKHLLAMTLALKEWEPSDVIPGIAAAHRDVAEVIFGQLRDAINGKRQAEALELVEHWMQTVPEAPALPWHQLWHLASWLELQKRLESKDYQSAAEYIREISAKSTIFKIDTVASQIILQTLKHAYQSRELALALLILAATNVPSTGFQQLATDEKLAKQFPEPLQKTLAVLRQTDSTIKVQPEVLIQGVATLPSQYRPAILAQLVEIALYMRKSQLIDATVLQEILRLSQTEHRERYRPLINYLTEDFADFERVKSMGPGGWRLLPQIYFMGGYFEEGIYMIELYQSNLFKQTQSQDFVNLVGDIFMHSTLPADTLNTALQGFENSRIWPDARVRAFTGALVNQKWSPSMEGAARRLTTLIFNNGDLTRTMSPDEILRLLQYHGERSNALDMLRVASAIIDKAIAMGPQGPSLLAKAWPQLSWQPEVGQAALELLRRYVRNTPPQAAQQLPAFFSEKLGKNVGEAVAATYLVRVALGADNLQTFVENLQITLALLMDVAVTYHPSKETPPIFRLRQDMDAMSGSLADDEREALTQRIMEFGQYIYEIGAQTNGGKKRPAPDWSPQQVLDVMPENAVEFLLWLGSFFAKGEHPSLNLERASPAHILGNRSLPMFNDDMLIAHQILGNLRTAFQGDAVKISVEVLTAEIKSMWEALSLFNQRQIEESIANDTWAIGCLLPYMAERASDKVFTDKGIGKKLEGGKEQPNNGLEAVRWIAGYFARRQKR